MKRENLVDSVSDTADRVRFFFAGVSKAGTTSLFYYLGQNPQIYACPIKDPSYFAATDFLSLEGPGAEAEIRKTADSVEQWVSGERAEPPKDGFAFNWSSYQALFEGVTDQIAVGEGSTTYWYAPRAARAISERLPLSQFSIHLYEDYCEDPGAVCRGIFKFLGVNENFDVDFS